MNAEMVNQLIGQQATSVKSGTSLTISLYACDRNIRNRSMKTTLKTMKSVNSIMKTTVEMT
jgi:hypothetical protein